MAKRNDTPGPLASTKPSKQPGCQLRRLKVGSTHDRDRRVPWIRIQGQWLSRAGFTIDTPVQVHVMEGCLIFKAGG